MPHKPTLTDYYIPFFIVVFGLLIAYGLLNAVIYIDYFKDSQEGMCQRKKKEDKPETEGFTEGNGNPDTEGPKPSNEDSTGAEGTTDCIAFCGALGSDLDTLDDYDGLKYRISTEIPDRISKLETRISQLK